MKPILTLSESKVLDGHLIEKLGLSPSLLVEKAGQAAAGIIGSEIPGNAPIVFLVGPGNNGADGLVAARALALSGHHVSVYLYKHEKANSLNREMSKRIGEYADLIENLPPPCPSVTAVEALFGFGFKGELSSALSEWFDSVGRVYALDAPAGFSYHAYKTITFTLPKSEFYFGGRESAGLIDIVNPGFPDAELDVHTGLCLIGPDDISHSRLPLTAYKNIRGHVALLAGSEEYTGAAVLASKALYKSGAGLVSLYSSSHVTDSVINSEPGVIAGNRDSLSSYDAVLAGPGWGKGDEMMLDKAIMSSRPMVIDADGLKLLNGRRLYEGTVLTPHLGEFRSLLCQYGIPGGLSEESIKALSSLSGAVVAVKSSVVYISDGKTVYVFDGENPALGVAGSGDILSAVIASALARGEAPLQAAIDGVIMHQSAGRRLADAKGLFTAGELLEEIGRTCFRYIFSR